jgi:hypothetical protein
VHCLVLPRFERSVTPFWTESEQTEAARFLCRRSSDVGVDLRQGPDEGRFAMAVREA